MHLDKEARDLDLKNNLEQKQHIIAKAKELLNEEDVMKAFRELQFVTPRLERRNWSSRS